MLTSTGQSLVEAGESYRQLSEIKYAMEDNVKQNFLEPLQHLQNKDIKEVNVSWFIVTGMIENEICITCPLGIMHMQN